MNEDQQIAMGYLDVIAVGAVLIGLVLVIHGTIVKNKWGFTFSAARCPRCGEQNPAFRAPRSVSQALWGGYRCRSCGSEFDKWGREVRERAVTDEVNPKRETPS